MAGKHQDPPTPRWAQANNSLMLFTAISLILLTFFILLVSKANFDDTKLGVAQGSIAGAFGFLPGGLVFDGDDSGAPYDKLSPASPEMNRIRKLLAPMIQDENARFTYRQNKVVISLEAGAVFALDSDQILPEIDDLLLQLGRIANDLDAPIIVESHTSDRPPQTEGAGDNWQISTARATAVMRFFMDRGGIAADRLSAYGYAGFRPMVINNSPKARAKNSRIDLIFDLSGDAGQAALKRLNKNRNSLNIDGFEFFIHEPETLNN